MSNRISYLKKKTLKRRKWPCLREVQHGNFAAMCLDGERGTPFLSVPRSVCIPLVWAGFLVSTIQEAKLHYSRSAVNVTSCF